MRESTGFNTGGRDDQSEMESSVGPTCQKVLLNWLWAKAGMPTLPN